MKWSKNLFFTFGILLAVVLAMIFPQYFTYVGDFQLKLLIIPLLQIVMFGMGSQMSLKDFEGVIQTPKAVWVGIVCQFTIMPLIAVVIIKLFDFPMEIAAGILLVGVSPSGLASNVMSFLAKANVALSVTLTAIATMLSPLVTPFLMKTLAGQLIPIDFWQMVLGIMDIVILPIVGGLIFNAMAFQDWQKRKYNVQLLVFALIVMAKILLQASFATLPEGALKAAVIWFIVLPIIGGYIFSKIKYADKSVLERILSLLSMLAIGVVIVVITATGRDSLMAIGALLILACLLHNLLGYLIGYWICRGLKMDEKSCRTIAFEVGMQNSGLASGIAVQMGKVATVGLAAAVFGPLMNISGSVLATWWRER